MSERANTPGGSNSCRRGQHRLDLGERAAKPAGDHGELLPQVAGVVHEVDQVQPDQPLGTGREVDLELLDQMLAQRLGSAQAGLEIGRRVVEVDAAAATERGQAADAQPRELALRDRLLPAVVGRPRPAIARLAAHGHLQAAVQLGSGGAGGVERGGRRAGLGLGTGRVRLLLALEQRVLLELALDIGRQLEVRELQQLDRLLQLRRHHQALALTQIEAEGQCHGRPA